MRLQYDNNIYSDMSSMGVIDTSEDSDLPRQKINTILQFKKTNFIVASMSYGYVAVVNIDPVGDSDVPNNPK